MSDVKLYNDDCMKVLPSLADGSISLTLTDIPYDEVNRKSGGLRNLDKSHADIITFPLDDFIDEIEGMDQEELSDWIHNKMLELTKEEEEIIIDSDTPGNIIEFKPKGGTYH